MKTKLDKNNIKHKNH